LQQKSLPGGSRPSGGREKVRPLSQAFHGRCARLTSAPLRAEPLTTARTARINDLAAAFGRHAGAKPMPAFAHQFARLISPLHRSILRFVCSSIRADCPRLSGIGPVSSVADCALGKISAAYKRGACSRQCKQGPAGPHRAASRFRDR
jgi:hypothetical protein